MKLTWLSIGANCSTKAFKDYLYQTLKLPVMKVTAPNKEATDDASMIMLKEWCDANRPELSPLFTLVQEYRKWGKIKSIYIDGYLKYLNSATGRIHSDFFALSTETGKMNCRVIVTVNRNRLWWSVFRFIRNVDIHRSSLRRF